MNTRVLGNSLVANLRIPGVRVKAISGLNWSTAVQHLIEYRRHYIGHTVYVVVGPVRFSRRFKGRREVRFAEPNSGTINQLFGKFYKELSFLRIRPVPCPLFPMNFRTFNLAKNDGRLICEGFYEEWNTRIRGHVVVENRNIFRFNTQHNMFTPCIHRRLFHRRRNSYVFRESLTTDGLHAQQSVVAEWATEIARVVQLSRTREANQ